jgi:hypothetical protein
MDALNLTNSAQYESIASAIGTATTAFGVGTRFTPPRRLMLGAKFRW